MMFEVDAVHFLIIIREGVRARHVAMVAAAIFVLVVKDRRGERGRVEGQEIVIRRRMVLQILVCQQVNETK